MILKKFLSIQVVKMELPDSDKDYKNTTQQMSCLMVKC